jgi:asparagine synthase (glutamine-hydrolysing)
VSTTPELCGPLQMEVRAPPLDQRVVEFCLGLPPECYARSGRTRLLIRHAMEGLLPPRVLWNERRGLIAADLGDWVRAEQAEIATSLRQLQASPLARHWLDLPSMVAGFENLLKRIEPRTLAGFGATLRGLTVGLFLLRFECE